VAGSAPELGTAPAPPAAPATLNIAHHIAERAEAHPERRAVVVPRGRDRNGRRRWAHVTFRQLAAEIDRTAHGLRAEGVAPGERILVLAGPSIELVASTFALYQLGAVPVFIDPGMGARNLFRSVEQVAPAGLIGVGKAHLAFALLGRRAARTFRRRVCIGRRPLLGLVGGRRLADLVRAAPAEPFPLAPTRPDDPAAILFTSGSTGPAKGVLYTHAMFEEQVRHLRDLYGLGPDDVDLPGLPIFALFSVALGATVVFPDMDAARPAALDPARWVEAIEDHGVTLSFGSPAIWGPVSAWCDARGVGLPSVRQVFMAGAPVPAAIHERLEGVLGPGARTHTPYGATEALPVATATGAELKPTFAASAEGAGTCVGRPVPGVDLRIVAVSDDPIPEWSDDLALPPGEVGEVVVRGPNVTRSYCARPDADRASKIADGEAVWHRMGDLGYLDAEGRLWFCGRKSHRVEAAAGRLHTVPVEAVFAAHPRVRRAALVGVGPAGRQRPVLVVEALPGEGPRSASDRDALVAELRRLGAARPHTAGIEAFLFHPGFPVDCRHNAKIRREELAVWAAGRIG